MSILNAGGGTATCIHFLLPTIEPKKASGRRNEEERILYSSLE